MTLEQSIDYKFVNSLLLAEAMTHPSLSYETQRPHFDNQRLEFLGDAVLQLTLTAMIYKAHPAYDEGQMTKLRSRLVSKDALFSFAKKIHLQKHILMGKGETANGGQNRASTLADGLEALIGAIFLDGGFQPAFYFIKNLIGEDFQKAADSKEEKNPKGLLQEILQAIVPESPIYEVIGESGPDHEKIFHSRIVWNGSTLAEGSGTSKKLAEANAAEVALNGKSWESA